MLDAGSVEWNDIRHFKYSSRKIFSEDVGGVQMAVGAKFLKAIANTETFESPGFHNAGIGLIEIFPDLIAETDLVAFLFLVCKSE